MEKIGPENNESIAKTEPVNDGFDIFSDVENSGELINISFYQLNLATEGSQIDFINRKAEKINGV